MATGTEGPDVLSNDPSLSSDTIDALGGDDRIGVTNPRPPGGEFSFSRVTVNGGDGVDTLYLSSIYVSLSPTSAFIAANISGIFVYHYGAGVYWSEVERLVVSGTAYAGRNQDGSYAATSWRTGDTADELSVGTVGGAPITVWSGGGNDEVTIRGNVGAGSGVHAGPGDDLVDFRGTTITSRVVFGPPDFGRINYLFANGEEGNDTLIGGAQENRLNGGAGDDHLRSGPGDDTLTGGDGDDLLYFGADFTGADLADGGDGRDVIVLQGNYALIFGATQLIGLEALSLQSGANTRWGDTDGNLYDYDITPVDANVPAGMQMIVNGQSLRAGEDLAFDGSAETDGSFLLIGGRGVDTLTGGAGNDLFVFDGDRWGAGDSIDGGAGSDSLMISAGDGLARIEFGPASLTRIESISVNNRYASDPAAKPSYEFVLDNSNVAPGATLIVNGSSLADPAQTIGVDGSAVQDGKLTLFGGAGADELIGGGGADLIHGAGGADTLTGGGGNDIFRYDAVAHSAPGAADRITDFQPGADKIDLARIDADTLAAGDQAFRWIGPSAFSGTGAASAGELRGFQSNGVWTVEGDTDGDGAADLVIEIAYSGPLPLSSAEFVL